jgi:hypothetical protein
MANLSNDSGKESSARLVTIHQACNIQLNVSRDAHSSISTISSKQKTSCGIKKLIISTITIIKTLWNYFKAINT